MGAYPGRLEHVEGAVALAIGLDVAEQEPRVHQGGDSHLGVLGADAADRHGEAGVDSRDFPLLEEVDQAHESRLDVAVQGVEREVADRIHHDQGGTKSFHDVMHHQEVLFQALEGGTGGVDLEESLFHPLAKVEADRVEIAQQLIGRFLVGEKKTAFSPPAGGVDEGTADAALAGAGRTGNQHAAALVNALAVQHDIETGYARAQAPGRGLVIEAQGGDGQDGDAFVADQEGIFVGAVGRAAVLDHPQAAGGHLVADAMIEDDHTIGDVLLQPVAGEGFCAALACDHRGQALILQPAEEAPQFRPQDGMVGDAGEEGLDRIQHHALGADRGPPACARRMNRASRS